MIPITEDKIRSRLNFLYETAKELPGANRKPSGWQARIAAGIWIKNEMVALGWNQARTSPFQAKYGRNEEAIFIHAETHALRQALRRFDQDELRRARTTMFIVRAKKMKVYKNLRQWCWGLAKPCPGCAGAIADFGISRVIYSLDEDKMAAQEWSDLL